jgi:hypothetical protein
MNRRARRGIGKSAAAALARLARQEAAGDLRPLPPAEAARLLAADLICRRGDGGFAITAAGRAHLARAALAHGADGIDPFRGQHLALAVAETATPAGRVRLIPNRCASDSLGDSQITCEVIQHGKRRVVCHGASH